MAKLSAVLDEWAVKLKKLERTYDDMDHKGQKGWKELGTGLMMLAGPVTANQSCMGGWGKGMFRDNVAFLTTDIPKQAAALKKKAEAYAKSHDNPKLSLTRAQTWTKDGREKEQARADLARAIAGAMDECAREFKSASLDEVPERSR